MKFAKSLFASAQFSLAENCTYTVVSVKNVFRGVLPGLKAGAFETLDGKR